MRLFNNKGLSVSISSRGSLREMLVKPKDRLETEELNGLFYHLPCAGRNCIACSCRYVGETERILSARFNEHTSTATNAQGHYKSAVLQHAREHSHHFRREDATSLAYEHDWAKRGFYSSKPSNHPSTLSKVVKHSLFTLTKSLVKY